MPVSMICTSCKKTQQPGLDPKTKKIFCGECHQEITNVTHFIRVQLETLKQFREETKQSFGIKCNHCGLSARPKFMGEKLVCGGCQKELTEVSTAFKLMLKEWLVKATRDI